MKITAILLAAGFSKRFNGNKLLAVYEEKPLVMHIVDKVLKQNFYEVIVISQYNEVLNLVSDSAAPMVTIKAVKNNHPEAGVSESIKLGIKASKPCDAYMFFVGDAPLIKEETIQKMIKTYEALEGREGAILCPYYEGERGNPVIFGKVYKEALLQLTGDEGGKQIIRKHPENIVKYEVSHKKELFDIDTQQDLNQL